MRRDFFATWDLGELVYDGALAAIASGRAERVKRLRALTGNLADSDPRRPELREQVDAVVGCFGAPEVGGTGGVGRGVGRCAAGRPGLPGRHQGIVPADPAGWCRLVGRAWLMNALPVQRRSSQLSAFSPVPDPTTNLTPQRRRQPKCHSRST